MRVGRRAEGARERWERDVIYVWSRFTLSSPYHETSPGSDNHPAADLCVSVSVWDVTASENIHTCVFLNLYVNMCTGVSAYVCLNWESINGREHPREDKACEVDAKHSIPCILCVCVCVCIGGPLLRLWSTKSPVLLHWIKPMIHGLKPHASQPDR